VFVHQVLLECLIRDIFFALLLALSVSFSNHKLPLLSETARVARNLLVAPCKAVKELAACSLCRAIPQARHLDLLFAQAVFKGQHRAWTRTTRPSKLGLSSSRTQGGGSPDEDYISLPLLAKARGSD
jgi:hypothetical protein